MAKYGRFDPKNKKKSRDKYRSDKKKIFRPTESKRQNSEWFTKEAERPVAR